VTQDDPSPEPLPGDWLPVGGKRVYLVEAGPADRSAPAVVLLHGIPTSSYLWRNVQRPLSAKFRVLAPDLLGLGRSQRDPGMDVSLRANAGMVRELLRLKGIGRAHVAGHDVGGAVAHILAADHRELIDRLALVGVVAFKEDWPVPIVKLMRTPVLGDLLAALPAGKVWEKYHSRAHARADRAAFLRFIRAMDSEDVDEALRRWAGHARKEPLPTLILWGRADPFQPPRLAGKLQGFIPGSALEIIEGAGHFIQEDVPGVLADRLAAFFSS
jgi:pimeloyl-ACP methyl ester carboxylesterase